MVLMAGLLAGLAGSPRPVVAAPAAQQLPQPSLTINGGTNPVEITPGGTIQYELTGIPLVGQTVGGATITEVDVALFIGFLSGETFIPGGPLASVDDPGTTSISGSAVIPADSPIFSTPGFPLGALAIAGGISLVFEGETTPPPGFSNAVPVTIPAPVFSLTLTIDDVSTGPVVLETGTPFSYQLAIEPDPGSPFAVSSIYLTDDPDALIAAFTAYFSDLGGDPSGFPALGVPIAQGRGPLSGQEILDNNQPIPLGASSIVGIVALIEPTPDAGFTLRSFASVVRPLSIEGENLPPTVTGLPASIQVTEDEPVSFEVTVGDDLVPVGDLEVFVSGATSTRGTPAVEGTGATRTISYTPNPGATGTDQFAFVVSDGSLTVFRYVAVTITAVNDVPVLAGVPAGVSGETTGDATTATPAFSLPTATDPDSTAAGNATTVTCAAPLGTGDASVAVTSATAFPVGQTVVTCAAQDVPPSGQQAGAAVTASFTVTITDGGDPVVNVPGDQEAPATGADGATVTFSVSALDAIDGTVDVTCAVPDGSGTRTVTSGATFPLGETEVTCIAEDAAGNEGAASFTVRVTDDGAPTLSLPSATTIPAVNGSGAPFTYTATASDAVDLDVVPSCQPASGSTFPLGETTVTCTATDDANNRTTGSFTLTVTDQAAPTLSLPAPISAAATGPGGAAVPFTATATDAVDGALPVTCTVPDGAGVRTVASGATFPLGTTTVTCTATDAAGNDVTGTFTVTVTDQAAPVFTSIPNVTVGATSNYGAAVTYALPTATDTVAVPTVSCLPGPGSQFPIGTTTVTCAASDGTNFTTGTFTVTVTNNGYRDPRDPRPGASPQTQPPPTPTPRPARPPRG